MIFMEDRKARFQIKLDDYSLLRELVMLHGVSGDEEEALQGVGGMLEVLKLQPKQLPMGNLVFGNYADPEVVVNAHIDEPGFQIVEVNPDGTLQFLNVSNVPLSHYLGQRVYVNGSLTKVSGAVFHRQRIGTESPGELRDLFIDVGAADRAEVLKMGVQVSHLGTFHKTYQESAGSILASSLDNRLGVFLLIRIAAQNREILKRVLFSLAIGEEGGGNSSLKSLTHSVNPRFALSIDVIPSLPKVAEGADVYPNIGSGPAVVFRAKSYTLNHKMRVLLGSIGKRFQPVFLHRMGTSEASILEEVGNTLVTQILVPVRGYHKAVYRVAKADIKETEDFIAECLRKFIGK